MKVSRATFCLLVLLLQQTADCASTLGWWREKQKGNHIYVKKRTIYSAIPPLNNIGDYHPLQSFPKVLSKHFRHRIDYFDTLFNISDEIFPVIPHEVKKSFMKELHNYRQNAEEKDFATLFKNSKSLGSVAKWFDLGEYIISEKIEDFLAPLPLQDYLQALIHVDLTQFAFPSIIELMRVVHPLWYKAPTEYQSVWNKLNEALKFYVPNKDFIKEEILNIEHEPIDLLSRYFRPYSFDATPVLYHYPNKELLSTSVTEVMKYKHQSVKEFFLATVSSFNLDYLLQENVVLYDLTPEITPHGLSIKCKKPVDRIVKLSENKSSYSSRAHDIYLAHHSLPEGCYEGDIEKDTIFVRSHRGTQEILLQAEKFTAETKFNKEEIKSDTCDKAMLEYMLMRRDKYADDKDWKKAICSNENTDPCEAKYTNEKFWDIKDAKTHLCTEKRDPEVELTYKLKGYILGYPDFLMEDLFKKTPALTILKHSKNNFMIGEVSLPTLRNILMEKQLFKAISEVNEDSEKYDYLAHLFESMTTNDALETLMRKYLIITSLQQTANELRETNTQEALDEEHVANKRGMTFDDQDKNTKRKVEIYEHKHGEKKSHDIVEDNRKKAIATVVDLYNKGKELEALPTPTLTWDQQLANLNSGFRRGFSNVHVRRFFKDGNFQPIISSLRSFANQDSVGEKVVNLILAASLEIHPDLEGIAVEDALKESNRIEVLIDATVRVLLGEIYPKMHKEALDHLVVLLN